MKLIGDYIRNGDSEADPYHSTVVRILGSTVLSINRCSGRLFLHIWESHVIDPSSAIRSVKPIGSTPYAPLKENFLNDEAEHKERTGYVR